MHEPSRPRHFAGGRTPGLPTCKPSRRLASPVAASSAAQHCPGAHLADLVWLRPEAVLVDARATSATTGFGGRRRRRRRRQRRERPAEARRGRWLAAAGAQWWRSLVPRLIRYCVCAFASVAGTAFAQRRPAPCLRSAAARPRPRLRLYEPRQGGRADRSKDLKLSSPRTRRARAVDVGWCTGSTRTARRVPAGSTSAGGGRRGDRLLAAGRGGRRPAARQEDGKPRSRSSGARTSGARAPVDNFNGAKLLGRTLRCDHCAKFHEEQEKDPDQLPEHVRRKLGEQELERKRDIGGATPSSPRRAREGQSSPSAAAPPRPTKRRSGWCRAAARAEGGVVDGGARSHIESARAAQGRRLRRRRGEAAAAAVGGRRKQRAESEAAAATDAAARGGASRTTLALPPAAAAAAAAAAPRTKAQVDRLPATRRSGPRRRARGAAGRAGRKKVGEDAIRCETNELRELGMAPLRGGAPR